jgi:hypothetical protein
MIEQKNNKAFVQFWIVQTFLAVLGTEESCWSAKEQEMSSCSKCKRWWILKCIWSQENSYTCPHCFNTLKMNIQVGGKYEVVHTEFLKSLLDDGRLTIEGGQFKGKRITFHDPCYLGRANNVWSSERVNSKLDAELVEMKRSRANGMLWSRRCSNV